jgi:hypothetical protein
MRTSNPNPKTIPGGQVQAVQNKIMGVMAREKREKIELAVVHMYHSLCA